MSRDVLVWSLLLSILCLGGNSIGKEAGERERDFVRSLELFDAAKSPEEYRQSAKVMESLLEDGFESGIVYYNLGNAYYRAGDFGRAIANYRKAKRFRPGDPYLEANLQQSLAMAPGKLTETAKPWWKHVFFWSEWMSEPTKILLSELAMSASAFLILLAFAVRKRAWYGAAAILMLFAIVGAVEVALSSPDLLGSKRAVVIAETVARKGTGSDYEAAFDQPLKDGAEFTILSETPNWTFGHFEGIGDGWVRNEFIAK